MGGWPGEKTGRRYRYGHYYWHGRIRRNQLQQSIISAMKGNCKKKLAKIINEGYPGNAKCDMEGWGKKRREGR
jgi:hypothetical protein